MTDKIFGSPSKDSDKTADPHTAAPASFGKSEQPGFVRGKKDVIVLSNKNPNEQKLDALMKGFGLNESSSVLDKENIGSDDVKIDITLRTQLGQAPVIMLLFTINDASQTLNHPSRASISFEVGLNGHITVVDTSGLWDEPPEGQETDEQKNEVSELPRKIAGALEISQDLGTLVEWVLRWRRQRKKSA